MNKRTTRLVALFVMLVMIVSVLTVLPFNVSAYNSDDDKAITNGTLSGTALPEGAEVYNGTPSTSLAGSGTEADPYLIANAADFMFFRDTFVSTGSVMTTVTATYKKNAILTTTVTDASGNVVLDENGVEKTTSTKLSADKMDDRTVSFVGPYAGKNIHFKLTGDIYLNDASYGTKGSNNGLSALTAATSASPNDVSYSLDANGNLVTSYTTNSGLASKNIVSTFLDADGNTTTKTCTNGSFSVTVRNAFSGVLDGDGHTIYNMYQYGSTDISLLYAISGTVKNLNFDGVRLKGTNVAILAQYLAYGAVIENVHVNNARLDATTNIGGLLVNVEDDTLIKNCSISGSIQSSNKYVGGIAAIYSDNYKHAPVTFEGCVNNASVKGTHNNSRVGGLLGADDNGANTFGCDFINCTNNGTVTATGTSPVAAGLVGNLYRPSTKRQYTNCVNNGDISGKIASGMIGTFNPGSSSDGAAVMTNCVNNGNITGQTYAGGFGGQIAILKGFDMIDCYNYGNISATDATGNAGGFFGSFLAYNPPYMSVYLNITNCANYGDITSAYAAGGIIGYYVYSAASTKIMVNGFVGESDVTASSYAGAIIGKFNFYSNASNVDKNLSFANTWLRGNISSESGSVGAFGAIYEGKFYVKTTKNKIDYYTPLNQVPVIRAANCGFDLSFYVNNTAISPDQLSTIAYYPISDRYDSSVIYSSSDATNTLDAFLALYDPQTIIVGYHNGTEMTNSPYPVADSATFVANAQASLNTLALANNYTPWAQDKTSPVPIHTIGFTGATMSLGGNMALNIKLNANAFANLDVQQVAFINAETGEGVAVTAGADYYTVSYENLRAADLAKEMKLYIQVTIGDETIDSTNVLTYSPATYLTNLFTDYKAGGEKANAENAAQVVAVAESMLCYGVAAEAKATGKAPAETATAAAAIAAGVTFPETFTATGYTNEEANTAEDAAVVNKYVANGIGATLTGGIHLTLDGVQTVSEVKVTINGENKTYAVGADGRIEIDMINADMILDVITLTFGDESADITIGNFLEARRANEGETLLAEATILYMLAVAAYVGE